MNNYPQFPNYGLRDKEDDIIGLKWSENNNEITIRNNYLYVDTRDCIGEQSLADAQTAYLFRGGRKEISGQIISTTGVNITPITVTTSIQLQNTNIINGDTIAISNVQGNTNANGT